MKSLNQIWAMELGALNTLMSQCKPQADEGDGDECEGTSQEDKGYQNYYGIALINVSGVLVKYDGLLCRLFGGVSTMDIAEQVIKAVNDSSVNGILIRIDSPGGMVSGVETLGNLLKRVNKPVWAYIDDMGASGAYWLASQCSRIYSNRTALIGSIGVYQVVQDTSKLYENAGVAVTVVKAGEFKGTGEDGTPITKPQLNDIQRTINDIYGLFVDAVATGRGMERNKAQTLADGRIHIASEAKQLGLIDEIGAIEDAIGEMINMSNKNINVSNTETNTQPVAIETVASATETPVAAVIETPVATATETPVAAVEPIATETETPAVETKVETVIEAKVEAVIPTAVDPLKDAKVAGYAEGMQDSQNRLQAVIAACENDVQFAIAQFMNGHDVGKAKQEYATHKEAMGGTAPIAIALVAPIEAKTPEQEWDGMSASQKAAFMNRKDWFIASKKI